MTFNIQLLEPIQSTTRFINTLVSLSALPELNWIRNLSKSIEVPLSHTLFQSFWEVYGKEARSVRLKMASELMKMMTPERIKLEPGRIIKLDENILLEKTYDGKLILYEVV